MNVEISDEQIEQMIKKAVDERVKTWFGEPSNMQFIRNTVAKVVQEEVSIKVNESKIDIPKLASKELADKIVDSIGYNIAAIFAEKYGD